MGARAVARSCIILTSLCADELRTWIVSYFATIKPAQIHALRWLRKRRPSARGAGCVRRSSLAPLPPRLAKPLAFGRAVKGVETPSAWIGTTLTGDTLALTWAYMHMHMHMHMRTCTHRRKERARYIQKRWGDTCP